MCGRMGGGGGWGTPTKEKMFGSTAHLFFIYFVNVGSVSSRQDIDLIMAGHTLYFCIDDNANGVRPKKNVLIFLDFFHFLTHKNLGRG